MARGPDGGGLCQSGGVGRGGGKRGMTYGGDGLA